MGGLVIILFSVSHFGAAGREFVGVPEHHHHEDFFFYILFG